MQCAAGILANGEGPAIDIPNADCTEPVAARVHYGRITHVGVEITAPGQAPRHADTDIAVRDFLVAGLGDSIASGDGNPDVPVALADQGFCFRRFLSAGRSEYFRPGRLGF